MRTPDFWIDRAENPDQAILSLAEIQQMNEAFLDRMKDLPATEEELGLSMSRQLRSWVGLVSIPPDLESLSRQELITAVQEMVQSQVQMLTRRSHGNALAIVYSENELNGMEAEMAFDRITEMKGIRHGIAVRDSRMRIVPTLRPEYVSVADNSRSRWDMFNHDIIPVSSPVQVLHTSLSGGYLLVMCDRGFGWTRSENIALADRDIIAASIPGKDFIVCTGEQVPYYSGAGCEVVSGWLRMGDRLSYSDVNGQIQVIVPCRNMDGTLSLEKAWLKRDADVSRGFLPYTKRNIIIQAFKLMDLVYDYTGAWFGRNHVTILRDLFSCFGFELPGNGGLLQVYNFAGTISPDIGKEAQYKAISANEPFTTIQITNAHSQLHMGEVDGVPYTFDTHGYSITGEDGEEYFIRRSCIGTAELPDYMLKGNMVIVKLK
jgi:hypothetical protein